jgi:beta-lactamase regulating signal transducer with metallopeptidase domain
MILLILDHLWQSTLFVMVACLLTLCFKTNSARVRYGIWLSASLKFLFPLVLLVTAGKAISQAVLPPLPAGPVILALDGAADPFSSGTVAIGGLTGAVSASAAVWNWSFLLALVWFAGFAFFAVRWARHWRDLRGLVAAAEPVAVAAPMPVKSSPALLEPGLVGAFHPVLLLPEGVADQLSGTELEAIVAHEVCHWRRRDNLTASLHMVVEAIFWFYPLVWWLETRLIAERERACDEAVVAAGCDPNAYAESILKVCKFYIHSPLACAAGVSGADLKQRVERIMENQSIAYVGLIKKAILTGSVLAVLAVPVMLGLLTAPAAVAQSTGASPYPGAEAALREQLAGWEKRQPVTSDLTQEMADLTRQQQPTIQMMMDGLGPLQSLTYKGRDEGGRDVYLATFQHGALTCLISQLVDGKIGGLGFVPATVRTDNGPSPGTQDALRQNIDGLAAGTPAFQIMLAGTGQATVRQLVGLEKMAKALGPLKTLTFKGVSPRGWDDYEAAYENGRAAWTIQPLIDGKIGGVFVTNTVITDAQPHPDREASLRRYIASLQAGSPNYDDMDPTLAAAVRQNLPQLIGLIKSLGALQAIDFDHGDANGSDVYHVTFERGKAEWTVGELTADGKAKSRGFRIL